MTWAPTSSEKPANGLQARPPRGRRGRPGRPRPSASSGRSSDGNPDGETATPPQTVGDGPTEVAERRRIVAELEDRLRFETLLSDLSARFINLPVDEVDKEIEAALGRIVQFLGLDRSTLFQLSEDETTLVVSHCWAAPGFVSANGLIPRDLVSWGLAKGSRRNDRLFERGRAARRGRPGQGDLSQDRAEGQHHVPSERRGRGRVRGAGVRQDHRRGPGRRTRSSACGWSPRSWPTPCCAGARSRSCGRRSPRSSNSRSGCCRRTSISARKPVFCTTTTTSSGIAPPSSRPSSRWSRWAHRRHRAAARRNRRRQGADGHGHPQPKFTRATGRW